MFVHFWLGKANKTPANVCSPIHFEGLLNIHFPYFNNKDVVLFKNVEEKFWKLLPIGILCNIFSVSKDYNAK